MNTSFLFRSAATAAAVLALLAGCGGGGGGPAPIPPSVQYEGICTAEGQKSFVRSYLNEVYLWYNEIQEVDRNGYATPEAYFNALLVQSRDQFSAAFYTGPLPRAQNLTATQARTAGLLSAHTGTVTLFPTFTVAGRTVGYLQFDSHDSGSQDDLIAAFQQLQMAGVQDLVLDMRGNQGGYLYVALTAASMITGPSKDGQVFEQLRFNDKQAALTAAYTLKYSGQVQYGEATYPAGTPLPRLDLPRVFVLTTGNTCSASESVINGLRGIDVQVIRIGSNTCGKPYGFQHKQTCGGTYHYFAIEFQGYNAKGFGDYQDVGFTPNCGLAATGIRGTGTDSLLNAAKHYIEFGTCPAGATVNLQNSAVPLLQGNVRPWGARLLLPGQRQP